MNILITGAGGFLGRNLKEGFQRLSDVEMKDRTVGCDDIRIMECGSKSADSMLRECCRQADIVYHFAGVMRPDDSREFQTANVDYTRKMIAYLEQSEHPCIVVFASSIQASLEGRFEGSEYGKTKKESEKLLREYAERTQSRVVIYRFPGIFGKWCKPNYNSVVATFCYNISHNLPIQVHDASVEIELAYIDDVVNELLLCLSDSGHVTDEYGKGHTWKYGYIPVKYYVTVGELSKMLLSFRDMHYVQLESSRASDELAGKMWSTYLSYMSEE